MANVTGVVIPRRRRGEKVRARLAAGFRHRDRHIVRAAGGQDLAHRHHGICCRKANVLRCLTALEAVLRRNGVKLPAGAAVDAAYKVYQAAGRKSECDA